MFRNEKFLGFVHPYNLLEYFQNKETDSNKTLLKHQHKNGSIKQFLNRGSNKFYCSHREKKEGTSMWNAWVLCVFVPFSHRNWRQAGLQLLYHLSLSCFFNKVMTSWYYAVTKSLIIDDVGVRDPPLVCLFPVQNTTKKIKIQQNRHLPVQSQKEEH